jgi:hypothetical protein
MYLQPPTATQPAVAGTMITLQGALVPAVGHALSDLLRPA